MERNQFTKQQIAHIYNDSDFVEYISHYFSSFNHSTIEINIGNSDKEIIDWKIYLRIVLANINIVFDSLKLIQKNISFSYEKNKIKSYGSIRGQLLIGEYVKNKNLVCTPKEYPCYFKEKTYDTPENEYTTYILSSLIDQLQLLYSKLIKVSFLSQFNTEKTKLLKFIDYLSSILRRVPFKSISTKTFRRLCKGGFPITKKSIIEIRFTKGKIRNAYGYRKLFDWYDKYIINGFSFTNLEVIESLTYDEEFSNKLFELWSLYKISRSFVLKYGMNVVDQNTICPGQKQYIYKFQAKNNEYIEVYYQKGSGIYWDDIQGQAWYYIDSLNNKGLIGIPDITIKCIGKQGENITLIDLKNRVRKEGQNSEEIYKMIGYFSNFEKYLKNKCNPYFLNHGILIFRNDLQPFNQLIQNDRGESILTISVGISNNYKILDEQFDKVCKFVLDNFNIPLI